jgi:ABC-type nitrate/sulfonate/bicarbonate transport system permease component
VSTVQDVSSSPQTERWARIGRKLFAPLLFIAVWFLVTGLKLVRPIIVPPPLAVFKSFIGMVEILPAAILTTVTMTLMGFVIGTTLGTAAGLLMAYSPTLRDVLGDVFDFLRPIPVFALIPMFILWFGIGRMPQIALITLGCSVILGVTTVEAIRNVPTIYVRAALTLGADRQLIYRTVIVPFIVPHLIGAVRVAAAASWGLDVAAEFMGSQQGLGFLIIQQQTYLRTDGIILLVLIYSILAIIMDRLLGALEKRLTGWTERRAVVGAAGAVIGVG